MYFNRSFLAALLAPIRQHVHVSSNGHSCSIAILSRTAISCTDPIKQCVTRHRSVHSLRIVHIHTNHAVRPSARHGCSGRDGVSARPASA